MVNAFSFCLYGPYNPFYYRGLLENIWLAGKYFPTWKVYVYLGSDVTQELRDHLVLLSSVVIINTGITGPLNMIHRFFAIDEPEVELMMVRDADSRIFWKDRWAIREFVKQLQYKGHVIRDNPVHKIYLLGGLWGMRKIQNVSIREIYNEYSKTPLTSSSGYDQDFLTKCIYPILYPTLLIHYSNQCLLPNEKGVEFPFVWDSKNFCGSHAKEGSFLDVPDPEYIPIKKTNVLNLPQVFVRIK